MDNDRKTTLLLEKKDAEENLAELQQNATVLPERLGKILELAESAYASYKAASPEEKRDVLKNLTSNCTVDGKNVEVALRLPFDEIAHRPAISFGGPKRGTPRTWDQLLPWLWEHCKSLSILAA
jgi:hypothetical protein